MLKSKMKLDDLYFGIMCRKLSYSGKNKTPLLKKYNLFSLGRIKHSVAMWVVMSPEERKKHKFLPWCFLDVWGRCEYEMIISDWPYPDDAKVEDIGERYDVYELYVKPNAELLEDMVNRVSKSSAQAYLKEYRKKFKK